MRPRKRLALAIAAKHGRDVSGLAGAILAGDLPRTEQIEIHVAHDWPSASCHDALPGHVFQHRHPPGTSIFRLWGSAIAEANADYVAILDASCPPAPGWWAAAWDEIDRGRPAFFGPVACGFSGADPGMLGYLVEYAQFSPPITPGMNEVPGNNVVFRRDLLDDDAALRRDGFSKTVTLWRLARQGLRPMPHNPAMRVTYRRGRSATPYWRRRYRHGRRFAAERCRQPDCPPRWLCVPFTAVLPVIRCWRIFRHVAHAAPLRAAFLRHAWAILLAETAWSAGECLGYLTRAPAAEQDLD